MNIFALVLMPLLLWGCRSERDTYLVQLRSGNADQRAQAAAFLGAQRMGEAIPHLQAALRDTVPEVRTKVIWALGMLRSKDAMRDLIPLLRDANRDIRQATVLALMQIEEPDAIPALENAHRLETDAWVKRDMARALQHLKQFEGETDVGESSIRGEFF